jgi:hypothetical protein
LLKRLSSTTSSNVPATMSHTRTVPSSAVVTTIGRSEPGSAAMAFTRDPWVPSIRTCHAAAVVSAATSAR